MVWSPATRWFPSTRSPRVRTGIGEVAGVATVATGVGAGTTGGFDGAAGGPAASLDLQLASASATASSREDDEPNASPAPTILDDTAGRGRALAARYRRSLIMRGSLYWSAPESLP